MNGASKGSSFERKICKQLSCWWSEGLGLGTRDDIFWRSSQSGGRATQRAKSGKTTFGSYGDIAAVDPVGMPLLQVFTIELKRGRSHGHPEDLIDRGKVGGVRPFEACINQTIAAHKAAGSLFWLLICQRDCRVPMVYMDARARQHFDPLPGQWVAYQIEVNCEDGWRESRSFYGMRLEAWLKWVSPQQIADFCANHPAFSGKS